jgi:hypothetical protein
MFSFRAPVARLLMEVRPLPGGRELLADLSPTSMGGEAATDRGPGRRRKPRFGSGSHGEWAVGSIEGSHPSIVDASERRR